MTRATTRISFTSLPLRFRSRLSIRAWPRIWLEIRNGLTHVNRSERISLSVSLEPRSCQPFSPSSGNEPPLPGAHAISRRTMPVRFYSTACARVFPAILKSLPLPAELNLSNRDDENKNRRKMKLCEFLFSMQPFSRYFLDCEYQYPWILLWISNFLDPSKILKKLKITYWYLSFVNIRIPVSLSLILQFHFK